MVKRITRSHAVSDSSLTFLSKLRPVAQIDKLPARPFHAVYHTIVVALDPHNKGGENEKYSIWHVKLPILTTW